MGIGFLVLNPHPMAASIRVPWTFTFVTEPPTELDHPHKHPYGAMLAVLGTKANTELWAESPGKVCVRYLFVFRFLFKADNYLNPS